MLIESCSSLVSSGPTMRYSNYLPCSSFNTTQAAKKILSILSLLLMPEAELQLDLEEASYYQQLQEVCDNATICQSTSAENAILPRTQILDKMALFNSITPLLFLIIEQQQLKIGNEL
ncbi:MAG: hypothetical protein COB23_04085 [Methylophaga sp.]|nr:MAG: hypothetical protein COB23_04085 [Methylophaga sp.]